MNKTLVVAVSQRVDVWRDRGEIRDALDQQLVRWLAAAGFLPVPVPNSLSTEDSLEQWLHALNPTALVLSGGNDIGDRPERDQTERGLLNYAFGHTLPMLGLCRGMQMMGVWAGGALNAVAGHVHARHTLQGRWSGEVNSFHHSALADCPPGFEVLARAEDDQIEAIRHTVLPWEGWMWHPEREADFSTIDLSCIRDLFLKRATP